MLHFMHWSHHLVHMLWEHVRFEHQWQKRRPVPSHSGIVGADASTLDFLAGHMLIGGTGDASLRRIADEGTVFVPRLVLESTGWLGDSAGAHVSGASARSIALWGAEGARDTLDSDVHLASLAASLLEGIVEVAGGAHWGAGQLTHEGDFERRLPLGLNWDGRLDAAALELVPPSLVHHQLLSGPAFGTLGDVTCGRHVELSNGVIEDDEHVCTLSSKETSADSPRGIRSGCLVTFRAGQSM